MLVSLLEEGYHYDTCANKLIGFCSDEYIGNELFLSHHLMLPAGIKPDQVDVAKMLVDILIIRADLNL